MADRIRRLGHSSTIAAFSFVGEHRELTIDTEGWILHVHDGTTAGGHPVARADMTNAVTATNVNNGAMTFTQVQQLEQALVDIADLQARVTALEA